jgi:hypothetical protein
MKKNKKTKKPKRSLKIKYGWNGSLSILVVTPNGLEEPEACKKIRWMMTNAISINGNK